MSENSLDHINNAISLLEITTKSFTARNHETWNRTSRKGKTRNWKSIKNSKNRTLFKRTREK